MQTGWGGEPAHMQSLQKDRKLNDILDNIRNLMLAWCTSKPDSTAKVNTNTKHFEKRYSEKILGKVMGSL